ncbi:hypothetical protein K457DRAFT_1880850 [Linnemannia elongata AG-77]|uniref:Piwi domain-containing protein n=1 Tax=Linnemannia elongata AG-77 TaxID=1314771 RepID=A0A197JGC5_9FUNG|nr:hypothetical protein K457DRAFT_1880850 [Linnemannia elongata AG-77]
MLASVDMKNAKYATSIQALEPRLQAIVDLEDMVAELLRAFVDKTMKKPERILFYRDRVLQGQFVQVHRDEVAFIRPACKKLYVTYVSKITSSSEALLCLLVFNAEGSGRSIRDLPARDCDEHWHYSSIRIWLSYVVACGSD